MRTIRMWLALPFLIVAAVFLVIAFYLGGRGTQEAVVDGVISRIAKMSHENSRRVLDGLGMGD